MKNRITQLKIPKGWQRTTLGLLVDKYVGGGTPARGNPDYWGGDISWLTVKDFPNSLYVEGASEYITEIGLEESASNIVPSGALITAIRVGLGRTFVTRKQIAINQDLRGIVPSKCIIPEYLARYLNFIAPRIIASGSGSTVKGITLNQLKGFEVIYPSSKEEQKKIAEILGSVDEEIQKADEIIAATEKLKRGLMQQLFTRGIGHTKFKETKIGQIPDGWSIENMSTLIDIKHGFAFKGQYFTDQETENVLLTPANFKIGGGFNDQKFKYYNGDLPQDYILNSGELLITMTDLSKAGDTLGYPALIPENFKKKYLHNQRLGKVKIKSNKVDPRFLYWRLMGEDYRKQILSTATGTTVRHTSPTKIQEFDFALPLLSEQKEIAEILSAVNEKISVNKKLKTKLERLKKGLMQDLLSGKVRVI